MFLTFYSFKLKKSTFCFHQFFRRFQLRAKSHIPQRLNGETMGPGDSMRSEKPGKAGTAGRRNNGDGEIKRVEKLGGAGKLVTSYPRRTKLGHVSYKSCLPFAIQQVFKASSGMVC